MSGSKQPIKPTPGASVTAWQELTHSRTVVLLMLFCVTGSLGLPLLIFSPVFSIREKWWWSIIVTLYTLLLLTITGLIVWWSWMQIRTLLT